ncbi:hypothetical protein V6N12_048634 [Hibiscus sabdariffa]|uniref:Uncharacterized protein n=1 Tax=Hibiscus sabdariffa TaxID=183260 RepID=A0ABR2EHV0_9ROSI
MHNQRFYVEANTQNSWELCFHSGYNIRAMAMSQVKFLGTWGSPFVMRLRIALDIKCVNYEIIEAEKLFEASSPIKPDRFCSHAAVNDVMPPTHKLAKMDMLLRKT